MEHEALTQEIAAYSCRNLPRSKAKHKVLDSVRLKYLTKVIPLSETQDLKTTQRKKTEIHHDDP